MSGASGVQNLLKKLEASPLVRKKLPNSAAVMNQYFNYRRHTGEAISAYLVRESLFYEEFVESLMELYTGSASVMDTFDQLTTVDESSDDEGHASRTGSERKSKGEYQQVPTEEADPPEPPGSPMPSRRGKGFTDSFILTQLRGWRLLSGAALNPDEWRTILASTKNQLDYDSISSALMVLFDDQIAMPRGSLTEALRAGKCTTTTCWRKTSGAGEHGLKIGMTVGSTLQTGRRRSGQQRRRSASTPRLQRRRRKVKRAKLCPLREPGAKHRELRRIFGKDHFQDYMVGKGKGKSVGKGSSGKINMVLEDFYNFLKGKSKGHVGGKGKFKPQVNAYPVMTEFDYYGLQIDEGDGVQMSAAVEPVEQASKQGLGMLDCGATCSAGPEASIKNLLSAIMAQDRQAQITIDSKKRPKFRFGSGSWGQALYQISIKSSLISRSFEAFVLPDPEGAHDPNFDHVPVLVGMNFIRGNQLIVDFSDGYTVCALQPHAKPFNLKINPKGHYMLDIPHYLCDGNTQLTGHAEVSLVLDNTFTLQEAPLSIGVLEIVACPVEGSSDEVLDEVLMTSHSETSRRRSFHEMWERRLSIHHQQQSRLMGNLPTKPSVATSSSRDHGAEVNRGGAGSGSQGGDGSQRSSSQGGAVAVQGRPQAGASSQQQMGLMDPLFAVRSSPELHSEGGSAGIKHELTESLGGSEGAQRPAASPSGRTLSQRGAGASLHREGRIRGEDQDADGPSQAAHGSFHNTETESF